ncbi:MAG TPA: accessory Sec system translocase SecA2 [Vicinamibacterales bacterium]|nr:accessory Sec system translocase SecA2 [Vicinamibacterales bacterium]
MIETVMDAVKSWSLGDTFREQYRSMTGTPVEHDVRRYFAVADRVNAVDGSTEDLPGSLSQLADEALRARALDLKARAARESLDALLPEVFAVAREGAARLLAMRPFDVQLAAGAALHDRALAQLATGEGKTLVAVAPAILHAIGGERVHIFTANDYLARRDAEWMGPLYALFGLRAAFVVQGLDFDARRAAYEADVTYVTAKEAGFDFLRDHTAYDVARIVHRGHSFAIVDEADFILIDEARVPLVIAGPAPPIPVEHRALAALARELRRGFDFDADEYSRVVVLTEAGFARASQRLGIALDAPHHHLLLSAVHVALHAQVLLRKDRDYVVRNGAVELVDEWTGRVADNRRWPHGIQPAVEAKEGVEVRPEGRVLGSIPMQHFIRQYATLAGMTATAESAAEEFNAFFGLKTVVFPAHRTCGRVDEPDVVFTHRDAKTAALVDEIARVHASGRPILVGTASVRESEDLSCELTLRGVPHQVLNARQDAHEARIIARAGTLGAVTISTNMAGRGTDIKLGGPDEHQRDAVVALGGLYVIGTSRQESLRIDNQLRGRAGRQGDPGTSRFFIALDDDLIRRYGVMSLIPKGHHPRLQAGPVDDPVVSREIARAQRIIEGQNFEIRRTLWKYSAMVDEQREIVYRWRQELLHDDADPGAGAERAAERYAELTAAAGADAVRHAEQRITIHVLDRAWADHLALIDDIREGIHLQRYGGREPIAEFHRQIVDAFSTLMDRVRDESVEMFLRLEARDGQIDLSRAGVAGSSSTWTYLINDNPFSTLGLSLLANRNVGPAAATGFLALLYLPLTMVVTTTVFVRRWLARRRGR